MDIRSFERTEKSQKFCTHRNRVIRAFERINIAQKVLSALRTG